MNFFDEFYNDVRDLIDEKLFELMGSAYKYNHGIE